jgi:hypothetical protein
VEKVLAGVTCLEARKRVKASEKFEGMSMSKLIVAWLTKKSINSWRGCCWWDAVSMRRSLWCPTERR